MNFTGIIGGWYEKYRRELPWRQTGDPYRVWLSEVILQQTRIDQGMPYYLEFVRSYPDVHALASATEDEVLKKWQGLGYYSRARNLLRAARQVVDDWDGEFPSSYKDLLTLRGVGSYTAAAIASICYGEPKAVVDGNVARFVARLYGVERPVNSTEGAREIEMLADRLMQESVRRGLRAGTHNQAMMEFGSIQCIPALPDCGSCPFHTDCVAYASDLVGRLPVKHPRKKPVERWLYYYIMVSGHELIFSKRPEGDIWSSLYQFPVIESARPLPEEQILLQSWKRLVRQIQASEGQIGGAEAGGVADAETGGPADAEAGEAETDAAQGVQNCKTAGEPADRAADAKAGGVSWGPTARESAPPYDEGAGFTITGTSGIVRHQLSHRSLRARFIHVRLDSWPDPLPTGWIRVPFGQVDDYAVPRLIHRYMESMDF